jgi:hypothetical protein
MAKATVSLTAVSSRTGDPPGSPNPNVRDKEGKTPLTRLTSPPNTWFYLAGHLWKPTLSDREDSAILLVGEKKGQESRLVHGELLPTSKFLASTLSSPTWRQSSISSWNKPSDGVSQLHGI